MRDIQRRRDRDNREQIERKRQRGETVGKRQRGETDGRYTGGGEMEGKKLRGTPKRGEREEGGGETGGEKQGKGGGGGGDRGGRGRVEEKEKGKGEGGRGRVEKERGQLWSSLLYRDSGARFFGLSFLHQTLHLGPLGSKGRQLLTNYCRIFKFSTTALKLRIKKFNMYRA
jgi:hypothetical protein